MKTYKLDPVFALLLLAISAVVVHYFFDLTYHAVRDPIYQAGYGAGSDAEYAKLMTGYCETHSRYEYSRTTDFGTYNYGYLGQETNCTAATTTQTFIKEHD